MLGLKLNHVSKSGPRLPLNAKGRPNNCLGHSQGVLKMFRHCHGRHSHHEVLNLFNITRRKSPRSLIAQCSLRWGRREARTLPSLQNGCIMLSRWSPHYLCVLLQNVFLNLGDASASLVPPIINILAEQERAQNVYFGIHRASFIDHGNSSTTTSMALLPFCLLSMTHCASPACLLAEDGYQRGYEVR